MKSFKKVILFILLLICLAFVLWVLSYIWNERSIEKNSTYCMDKVRWELWEGIGNIVLMYDENSQLGKYVYTGSVSYEDDSYSFSCVVLSKDEVDLKLDKVIDEDAECNWKFIHWVESNWKVNNDVVDDVDYRYDAQVFYSPVTKSCIWLTTLAEYDKMFEYAKVEYNIYDLEKDWRLFHDVKDSNNFTGVSFLSVEQFLDNPLVSKDILERLEYYKSGIAVEENIDNQEEDLDETFDENIEEDIDENIIEDIEDISWDDLLYD